MSRMAFLRIALVWLLVTVGAINSTQQVWAADEASGVLSDVSDEEKQRLRRVLLEVLAADLSGEKASEPKLDELSDSGYNLDNPPASAYENLGDWTTQATQTSGPVHQRIRALKSKLKAWDAERQRMWNNLTDGQGVSGLLNLIISTFGMVLVGLLCERFLARKLSYFDSEMACLECDAGAKAKWVFSRAGVQFLRFLAFGAGALLFTMFWHEHESFGLKVQLQVLSYIAVVWIWYIVFQVVFAPNAPALRFMQTTDDLARSWYLWFMGFIAFMEFGGHVIYVLMMLDLSSEIGSAVSVLFSVLVMLVLYVRLFQVSRRGESIFRNANEEDSSQPPVSRLWLRSALLLFCIWMLVVWAIWARHVFLGNWDESKKAAVSWWITLTFPVIDRLVYAGLSKFGHSRLFAGKAQSRGERFISVAHMSVRLLLLAIAVYALSLAWGFGTDRMLSDTLGMRPIAAAIDVLVILVMGYVVWELIQAAIDRHLPDIDGPSGTASLEGEGGGAGATRAETLMPLLRTCVLSVLALFVTLSVLSSLGVQIGPLLAGAGVVGIAIGFGAQKLVQDILSGIFFLVDDAFRRGEYIEIEDLRGTVEKTSLRSMQLRHHLGAVQTIPYGEIKTVRNLSRDWVTMKLELRLPYDTDIEKVRKIVKKVGQKMLEDEEMGPSFLLPLKSQGVFRMEESALIVRIKFTTKPGEQWVVRREAYRRVKEALELQGIHFAHREVRVRLPEGLEALQQSKLASNDSAPPPLNADEATKLSQAAAAAATSMLAAEAARMDKLEDLKDTGDER